MKVSELGQEWIEVSETRLGNGLIWLLFRKLSCQHHIQADSIKDCFRCTLAYREKSETRLRSGTIVATSMDNHLSADL